VIGAQHDPPALGVERDWCIVIAQGRRDQQIPFSLPSGPVLRHRQVQFEPRGCQRLCGNDRSPVSRKTSNFRRRRARAIHEVALELQLVLANSRAVEVLLEPHAKRRICESEREAARDALYLVLVSARSCAQCRGCRVINPGWSSAGAIPAGSEQAEKERRGEATPSGHSLVLECSADEPAPCCDGAANVGGAA